MATIQKKITLKEAVGTKFSGTLPATPIATFPIEEINVLLAGTTPVPEGIRFHFEKAAGNTTVGLIGVSLGVHPVDSPAGGMSVVNFEITSATKKYVWHGTQHKQLTDEEYRSQFPSQANKTSSRDGISNACVFFSRLDLKEIGSQAGITHMAFFLTTIERTFTSVEVFDTLVAVGLDSAGVKLGLQIRSEDPCPPHCGDDYP